MPTWLTSTTARQIRIHPRYSVTPRWWAPATRT